jgi:AraC-like DNA-binding protein
MKRKAGKTPRICSPLYRRFAVALQPLRRDLAIHRLTQTRDSISDIANTLGLGDIASFYRAFRGWTGVAPGAYRRDGGAPHADA